MVEDRISPALNKTPGPVKVSVLMITYNHESFIAQAVNSVLMQQADFEFELVIGEDCSKDNTRARLLELRKQHPDKIRLLPFERNLGVSGNFARTYFACQGQYVAILEGDDYWTDPFKLQRQVDFLDAHPDCTICFHNVQIVSGDGPRDFGLAVKTGQKEISKIDDLLEHNFIPTCSVVFRRGLITEFPDWWYQLQNIDWHLNILNAQYGSIGYIDEVMAAYRRHTGGVWSGADDIHRLQAVIISRQTVNANLNYNYDEILAPRMSQYWDGLMKLLIERGVELGSEHADLKHVTKIFDHWPNSLAITKMRRNKILAEIYTRLFFQAHKTNELKKARYCLFKLIQYEPSNLFNRGIWSIGIEAFFGRRFVEVLRGFTKFVFGR